MEKKESLKIEFTDILYAVVISIAISKLSLRFSFQNFMLLFALLIIFDDWLDYHIGVLHVRRSPQKYFIGYILDILILLTWYFITITPPSKIELYLSFIIAFFFLAGIWDIFISRVKIKNIFESSYFQLSIIYSILLVIYFIFSFQRGLLLGISIAIFIILRIPSWRNLLKEASLVFE